MSSPDAFEVVEMSTAGTATLAVRGELDMHTARTLTERVEDVLSRNGTELVIDLGELGFMDSSGLRLLIDLHHRSQRETWRLRLVAPRHEEAALALRVSGADAALPFEAPEGR